MINPINPKNNDENNDENNDKNNDVTIVGTDFFTDSESFLNELTDDELQQVRGGKKPPARKGYSSRSLFLC
jgi:bacteriocin-like protein